MKRTPPTQQHVLLFLALQLIEEGNVTKEEALAASAEFKQRAREARSTERAFDRPNAHTHEAEVWEALAKLYERPESWRPE
jgi:hypothetical protein